MALLPAGLPDAHVPQVVEVGLVLGGRRALVLVIAVGLALEEGGAQANPDDGRT